MIGKTASQWSRAIWCSQSVSKSRTFLAGGDYFGDAAFV